MPLPEYSTPLSQSEESDETLCEHCDELAYEVLDFAQSIGTILGSDWDNLASALSEAFYRGATDDRD